MTFGIHLCRGNQRSMWHREGTYDADRRAAVQRLGARPLSARVRRDAPAGFEPLRFVPEGKIVVLGLVSTKIPQLESVDDL